jgi:membrane-associated phospholipid phosphatase
MSVTSSSRMTHVAHAAPSSAATAAQLATPAQITARSDRRYYIRVALTVYAIWAVFYEAVGRLAATLPTLDWTTHLDRMIPLTPSFVWIYSFCYIFPFLPLIVIRDWHRFNRALIAIVVANVPAFIVFLVFPVAMPRAALGSSLSERLLSLIYAGDFHPAVTSFPSLHVIFAWLIFCMCRGGRWGRVGDVVIFAVALGITISTMFVKQHIILDAATGVVWAMASWKVAGILYRKLTDPHATPRAALRQVLRRVIPVTLASGMLLLLAIK